MKNKQLRSIGPTQHKEILIYSALYSNCLNIYCRRVIHFTLYLVINYSEFKTEDTLSIIRTYDYYYCYFSDGKLKTGGRDEQNNTEVRQNSSFFNPLGIDDNSQKLRWMLKHVCLCFSLGFFVVEFIHRHQTYHLLSFIKINNGIILVAVGRSSIIQHLKKRLLF